MSGRQPEAELKEQGAAEAGHGFEERLGGGHVELTLTKGS